MYIRDKDTMRALCQRGAFGNKWQTWPLHEYIRLVDPPHACLMYNGRPGVLLPRYTERLSPLEIAATAKEWVDLGCYAHNITVNVGEHDAIRVVLQGEVQRDDAYISLFWAGVNLRMRAALMTDPHHESGLSAVLRLQRTMDTASWENLQRLWDDYPDSVIEFTVYNCHVGDLGHNTVFWECRNY